MKNAKREQIFERIAGALLVDFIRVYYLDARTGEYEWYSSEADRENFCSKMSKENLLAKLRENTEKELMKLYMSSYPPCFQMTENISSYVLRPSTMSMKIKEN